MNPGKRNAKQLVLWMAAFLLLMILFQNLKAPQFEVEIPYSSFKQKLRAGEISEVTMRPDLIRGEFRKAPEKGADGTVGTKRFRVFPLPDPDLVKDMDASNLSVYKGEQDKTWVTAVLINLGWVVLFFLLWWVFVIRQVQMGGKQAMSFGRSKAKLHRNDKKKRITFKDVAGVDEAKEELEEIIAFLKDPAKFTRLGGRIPKGVLLFGPPGTGKTLLAKAVAGEADVPFFSASGSEFVEMFVGVGASRVRDLFEQAKKAAPAVIFIDELDAVGRSRFAGIGGGHDEREQTLNQILIELDGFEGTSGVILIAATNRPDVLDPALLRPGRFDRHVTVSPPDRTGRAEILKVHSAGVKLGEAVDLEVIARRTPGFVGADLANLVNEAALLAARRDREDVSMAELEEAIDRVMAGPSRKSRGISEKEKKVIAYHESGHTLIAKLLPGTDRVHKVSIIPRGPALGYTLQLPLEDKYLTTKTDIMNRLCVLLGGRVAEELVFGEITTGATDDLNKATAFVRRMIMEFGMNEKLGTVAYKKESGQVFLGKDIVEGQGYSDSTAELIDSEVKRILADTYAKVLGILEKNRELLEAIATRLIEKEVIEGEELDSILQGATA
ncbi:MAG: cell division protein FtsH [Elusimicrobia bacterium CG1_02_63_36]|nr:MAG: cell division protein FtsH [Elusimicrobia bacterium CG1_02_63_36]PIP82813.1 MAG: cell division protein FtsH [Elusimicrobia bacterium CG22_combo_CG10-13_8_21_14_all_63_91]PJA16119.1 MAG: cell division protein FtsH [Elusimicrobia bacterium CG_4_10_14_0_2_um_filter_63_34]PJB26209.1 MAG: cell division protein FtsH [Elusimicrobia bacterium CG_4_9_14_3_um_filter_62_55]